MRVDENLRKKEKLINNRKKIIKDEEETTEHEKFLAYGEFDRIGFEKIEKFSKFRDVPEKSKVWIGDRQTVLTYDIFEEGYGDAVFYEKGNFYEKNADGLVRSGHLFIGITILQFKDSQKENQGNMGTFMSICKRNILKLVNEEAMDIKCSVLGTLGSFGLTVIWLSDQYCDILKMVTKIRNTDIGKEKLERNKSIFLSAYTIFAQNHPWGANWEQKIRKIKGEALLRLTLKRGVSEKILESLKQWRVEASEIYHSAGEHDIVIRMKAADTFNIFSSLGSLHYDKPFFKDNILQSNLQLCEDIKDNTDTDFQNNIESENEISKTHNNNREAEEVLPELEKIQNNYIILRHKFGELFPSTAGMVDTLDWLYTDYIAKVSTASNEMWTSNFSYQFLKILECLTKLVENLDTIGMLKKDALQIVNDLLGDFERQIFHIAESNNLILGTPTCQFRYSGQNNLTLYSYFGIIKSILEAIYKNQKVSTQAEIVPLIVADSVPIIKSNLFIEYNNRNDARIVTINLPMMSLYNPVCYYPYLFHEIFHYAVPNDRNIRNKILGCLMSMEILRSLCIDVLAGILEVKESDEKKQLKLLIQECLMEYIYTFVLRYYERYLEKKTDNLKTFDKADEAALTAEEYEKELYELWIEWINAEEKIALSNNCVYLFFSYLYNEKDRIIVRLEKWEEKQENKKKDVQKMVKEVAYFIEHRLDVFSDSPMADTLDRGFENLMVFVTEDVLDDALVLMNAIREAMADIAMVMLGKMELAEYMLLFTKTKRDLLLYCQQKDISIQDYIRIGMVVDFLSSEKLRDNSNIELMDDSEDNFINMYCGLYYSTRKAGENKEYVNQLCKEGKEWFMYWKTCFHIYYKRYRMCISLFSKLQKQLLNVTDTKDESSFWKEYAETLKNYGKYIRNSCSERREDWKAKRAHVNQQIFDLNIRFIHKFQYQPDFADLNQERNARISTAGPYQYEGESGWYEDLKLYGVSGTSNKIIRKSYFWEYNVSNVGQLGELTAVIAEELKKSGDRLLSKNEHPIWYRGQQSIDYKLVPSIMRKYKEQKAKQRETADFSLACFIRSKYEEFKFKIGSPSEAIDRIGYTEADYISLMQHYSSPTNFLDWTEDAMSALYFALEGFFDSKAEKTDKDAALYVFSPALYNYARKKILSLEGKDKRKTEIERLAVENAQAGIPNLTMPYNREKYEAYMLGNEKFDGINSTPYRSVKERDEKLIYYLPIAVYTSRLNKRIQAQDGIFLAYNIYTSPDKDDGFDYISLEEVQKYYFEMFKEDEETCPFLYKIAIKKEERERIASWVKTFGMSKEKCYPELSSIGERLVN